MLSIHILNVDHGDSIVIHHDGSSGPVFAVIDSNIPGPDGPPALAKLRELGAERISFVALTHPHYDHFSGLPEIIYSYRNKIDNFYSFPVYSHMLGRLKKLCESYKKIHDSSDSPKVKSNALEYVKTLLFVKQYIGIANWEEHTGMYNRIQPKGFSDVEISVLLPPAKVKGRYFDMLDKGNIDDVFSEKENNLSLAFSMRYKGHEIILGGDSPSSSWRDHQLYCKNGSVSLNGNIAKLPHHGSKEDCSAKVIEHIFRAESSNIGCISANGRSHPHPDTLGILKNEGVLPYCTNLSETCGNNLSEFASHSGLSPVLSRLLRTFQSSQSKKVIQPCQGDINIVIDNGGQLTVSSEYNHPCSLRGDYDFFFSTETPTTYH